MLNHPVPFSREHIQYTFLEFAAFEGFNIAAGPAMNVVMVMAILRKLIPAGAVSEVITPEQAALFQRSKRAIDGRQVTRALSKAREHFVGRKWLNGLSKD